MDADPRFHPRRFRDINERQQILRDHSEPTVEELQEFKSCMQSSLFKLGLPFAVGMHYFNSFMKTRALKINPPSVPPPVESWLSFKRTVVFFGNICIGVFLYSPFCYQRLKERYIARQQKLLKEKEEGGITTKAEGNILQTNDVNSYGSLDPNLDGPKSAFSHLDLDFDSSVSDNLILEDVQDPKSMQSIPETTYDDLRRRNRENFRQKLISPASPDRDDPRQKRYAEPVTQKQTSDEPSSRKVIKNKYGDEMES